MADIGISVGQDVVRESVLINPGVQPTDKVIKIRDEAGRVIGAEVREAKNIISEGGNAKEAARKIYGRF